MADPTRAATIRRLYHDERCSITEIATHLRCHPSDCYVAILGRRSTNASSRRRWLMTGPVHPVPVRIRSRDLAAAFPFLCAQGERKCKPLNSTH